MDSRNDIYMQSGSREHPVVKGHYALLTAPIIEAFDAVTEWIEGNFSGGYVFGFSRFGKTVFVESWLPALLSEHFEGRLAVFNVSCKYHKAFSEAMFLSELLGASEHAYDRGLQKKNNFERLTRYYATAARNFGGNKVVLIIDEAQDMNDLHYRTICNIENELARLRFKFCTVSIGSHEMSYRHEMAIESGHIHLNGRYLVRHVRFRGINSLAELAAVLESYDLCTEWPEQSGISFTRHFFPNAFDDGFRLSTCAELMWAFFSHWAPEKLKPRLEVPMEHIAKAAEYIFRRKTETAISSEGLREEDVADAIKSTQYSAHMNAIAYSLPGDKEQ